MVGVSDRELPLYQKSISILKLALSFNMDIMYGCRVVSEQVCKYILGKPNPRLIFERNYIRPYRNDCIERIYIGK
ncbi:MAG: hypothetical protein QW738_07460 [Nitrososphaeria archaeon]